MKQFYHSSQCRLFPKQFRVWSNDEQTGFDCVVWLPYGITDKTVATRIIRSCGYQSFAAIH